MQTTPDCLPCFLKQASHTAGLCKVTATVHDAIMAQTEEFLQSIDFTLSPPENAVRLYGLIAEVTGIPDPFATLKKESNQFAARLKPVIGRRIKEAGNRFLAALSFAIAGNIIDYGSLHQFDMEKTIETALRQDLAINDYAALRTDLHQASMVLYLGDNSGELVFDGLVIEMMKKNVIYAVKEKAIINDALLDDARECGLDTICRVVTNGTGCPGTPLADCSKDFLQLFYDADLIISKGQGNFETLSEVKAPIYFLLTAKCPVVAGHIQLLTGGLSGWREKLPFPVLLRSPNFTKRR
ncbi:MAG: DUF89 family protein [Deltaproteobacteria bacterium]|nr:DUF89 family protein [Deltaproteobacteria bacterium]